MVGNISLQVFGAHPRPCDENRTHLLGRSYRFQVLTLNFAMKTCSLACLGFSLFSSSFAFRYLGLTLNFAKQTAHWLVRINLCSGIWCSPSSLRCRPLTDLIGNALPKYLVFALDLATKTAHWLLWKISFQVSVAHPRPCDKVRSLAFLEILFF